MTLQSKSVTERLEEVRSILAKDNVTVAELITARDHLDQAMNDIQLARCSAQTALNDL